MNRERIFEIIEAAQEEEDKASVIYDIFMMAVITLSLVPLAFKEETTALFVVDKICAIIFIIDYILRLATADIKFRKKTVFSFVRYPFSFMAVIDLISILPSLTAVNSGFKLFRVVRMLRALRVLRVIKAARYSRSVHIITDVLRKSRDPLIAVGSLSVVYILVSALIIINVEPDSFDNFFDAVYWATVSLTTMGYGDIYPVTMLGRLVTMVSSLFGIAIVALPSGIITVGYLNEVAKERKEEEEEGKKQTCAGEDPVSGADDRPAESGKS